MKQLFANMTLEIYMGSMTKTAYLNDYKKDDIISVYNFDFEFKIKDINYDFIIIESDKKDDRFKITENKILLKDKIKIVDTIDNSVTIYIRLDSINEK